MDNYIVVGDPELAPDVPPTNVDASEVSYNSETVEDALDKSFMNHGTTAETDMNNIVSIGTHTINPSVTTLNVPISGTWGFVEVFKHGTSIVQLWVDSANAYMYTRVKSGSPLVWSSWRSYEQLVTFSDLPKYGIATSGTEKVNATLEDICKKVPGWCEVKIHWVGNQILSDGSYRFGTLGAQMPELYGSLYIHKIGSVHPCIIEFIPYNSGNHYTRNFDYINSANHLSAWTNITITPSHIGQIIESTTLDTLAKVQAIYGSNTTWIQHTGYVLRGATSGVVANSATKTGGSDDATLVSHNHTFTGTEVTSGTNSANPSVTGGAVTGGITGGSHRHASVKYRNNVVGSGTVHTRIVGQGDATFNGTYYTDYTTHTHDLPAHTHTVSGSHTHKVTASGTISTEGSSGTSANIPNYKSVYIWERTA